MSEVCYKCEKSLDGDPKDILEDDMCYECGQEEFRKAEHGSRNSNFFGTGNPNCW